MNGEIKKEGLKQGVSGVLLVRNTELCQPRIPVGSSQT